MAAAITFINSITQNLTATSFLTGLVLGFLFLPIYKYIGNLKKIKQEIRPFAIKIEQGKICSEKKEAELYELYHSHHYNVLKFYIAIFIIGILYSLFAFSFFAPSHFFDLKNVNTNFVGVDISSSNFFWWIPFAISLVFLLQTEIQNYVNKIPFNLKNVAIASSVGILSLFCVMTFTATAYFIFQIGFSVSKILSSLKFLLHRKQNGNCKLEQALKNLFKK